MPPRTRNAYGVPALLALVAILAAAVMALPGPEPSAVPSSVQAEPAAPVPVLIRAPAATPIPAQEREGVPTWERFQVQVHDADGRPLAGAEVRYYLESTIGFPEDEVGLTDAAGRFVSPLLAPGAYRVRVPRAGTGHDSVQEIVVPSSAGSVLEFRAVTSAD